MSSMYCTNCGNEIPEGHNFCVNCGTPVFDDSAFTMEQNKEEGLKGPAPDSSNIRKKENRIDVVVYCAVCGEVIPNDKRSCPFCGAPIGKQSDPAGQRGISPEAAEELALAGQPEKKPKRKGIYTIGLIVSALVLAVGIAGLVMHMKTPAPDKEEATTSTTETTAPAADNAKEQETEGALTEAEAKEAGGLFVKDGDSYTPLLQPHGLKQRLMIGSDSCHSVYFMPIEEADVPAVNKTDELVVFQTEGISGGDDGFEALQVRKKGFTVNALFSENKVETGIVSGLESGENGQISHKTMELYTVNEMPARDFYEKETAKAEDFCSRKPQENADDDEAYCNVALADLRGREELRLEYSEETDQQEKVLTADLRYWIIDGCDSPDGDADAVALDVNWDDEETGTIDADELEPGNYILRTDAKADAYVVRIEEEQEEEQEEAQAEEQSDEVTE